MATTANIQPGRALFGLLLAASMMTLPGLVPNAAGDDACPDGTLRIQHQQDDVVHLCIVADLAPIDVLAPASTPWAPPPPSQLPDPNDHLERNCILDTFLCHSTVLSTIDYLDALRDWTETHADQIAQWTASAFVEATVYGVQVEERRATVDGGAAPPVAAQTACDCPAPTELVTFAVDPKTHAVGPVVKVDGQWYFLAPERRDS